MFGLDNSHLEPSQFIVLVVDDNQVDLQLLVGILANRGYQVRSARNVYSGTQLGTAINISNSGVTLSPHELSCIFDKFYRVPNSDPWKYSGTGLGLSLVKQLVEHIQGTITAENVDHVISFTIKLPVLQ